MTGPVAFVLGGGGLLGAHEVGMLRALLEAGIVPDLVVGTSVGAVNGAVVAAEPTGVAVDRLAALWRDLDSSGLFAGSLLGQLRTLARTRTSLHSEEPLRALLDEHLPVRTFGELVVPFQCVAASVERAAEHWFSAGSLTDAVLASCAVPGLLPPARGRRRDVPRRRPGAQHPDRPCGRPRRPNAVRHAGGPDRAPAQPAAAAVGGGAGRVRDRPAAPVRHRHGVAARRRHGAPAADRRRGPRPAHPAALPGHRRDR